MSIDDATRKLMRSRAESAIAGEARSDWPVNWLPSDDTLALDAALTEAEAEVEGLRVKLAGLDNEFRLAAGEMRDDGYITEDDLEAILSVVDSVLP